MTKSNINAKSQILNAKPWSVENPVIFFPRCFQSYCFGNVNKNWSSLHKDLMKQWQNKRSTINVQHVKNDSERKLFAFRLHSKVATVRQQASTTLLTSGSGHVHSNCALTNHAILGPAIYFNNCSYSHHSFSLAINSSTFPSYMFSIAIVYGHGKSPCLWLSILQAIFVQSALAMFSPKLTQ